MTKKEKEKYMIGWKEGFELGFRKGYYGSHKAGKNLVKADVIKSVCDHNWKPCEHEAVWEFDKCTKCDAIR